MSTSDDGSNVAFGFGNVKDLEIFRQKPEGFFLKPVPDINCSICDLYSGPPDMIKEHEKLHNEGETDDSDFTDVFARAREKLEKMSQGKSKLADMERRQLILRMLLLGDSSFPGLEISLRMNGESVSVQEFISLTQKAAP